jgi:hypothetical protein|tara:strand:- start:3059 stop:3259 length:201 start_codon:yes stop_codon:yes gene_type:complete
MKTKTKFICVSPTSDEAKYYFEHKMDKFHSCRVKEVNDEQYYLESLNKDHYFWLNKNGDHDWRIVS